MRRAALALALALAAFAASARAQTSPILPGYWESTERYSVLLSGGGHDRKCLTSAEVADFIAAPHTKHYTCRYREREVGDGRAAFHDGACYSHKGRQVLSDVRVEGRYAPESFHLDFRFNLLLSAGVGLPGTGEIDAHRLSAQCPASPQPDPAPASR